MGASEEIKQGKRTNTKTVVQKNFLELKKDLKWQIEKAQNVTTNTDPDQPMSSDILANLSNFWKELWKRKKIILWASRSKGENYLKIVICIFDSHALC